MKKYLLIVLAFVASTVTLFAQSKDEQELIDKTYLLSHTVFGTKDSATLESLLAKTVTYGHSHGNLQTREEMLKGVTHNQSLYTDTSVADIKVYIEGKTGIVRYLFKAKENKKDGSVVNLNFTMLLVWIKEKGVWKLMGRQAVSLGA